MREARAEALPVALSCADRVGALVSDAALLDVSETVLLNEAMAEAVKDAQVEELALDVASGDAVGEAVRDAEGVAVPARGDAVSGALALAGEVPETDGVGG